MTNNRMTWKQFKDRIEEFGVVDGTLIEYIDVNAPTMADMTVGSYDDKPDGTVGTFFVIQSES